MNILVFDIETIPDTDSARKLKDYGTATDAEVAAQLFAERLEKTGSEFLPHHLHKVAAISVVLRQRDKFKVWSIGDESSSEAEILQRFFDGIERYTPTLVSWNGSGFDLPVLHYRSLLNGTHASRYWEKGHDDSNFKWNNYLSRYHDRHTDLMDVLAGYTGRANAPLDQIATMLGFPGKMGMDGSKVWDAYQTGNVKAIRDYCETDVLNTFLVYCRFLRVTGQLTDEAFAHECDLVKQQLLASEQVHLVEFAKQIQLG